MILTVSFVVLLLVCALFSRRLERQEMETKIAAHP
jgi:hypothetical protein